MKNYQAGASANNGACAGNSFSNGNCAGDDTWPAAADWYAGNTDPRLLHHWAALA